uniref:Uncharacterized protein n=1 Tax=Oryza sativa subsp. japonica TaxID=39947 RepID=Q6K4G8_ORYSJ|nr:hypothetical protein [Oryza sativa Japonica Group]
MHSLSRFAPMAQHAYPCQNILRSDSPPTLLRRLLVAPPNEPSFAAGELEIELGHGALFCPGRRDFGLRI